MEVKRITIEYSDGQILTVDKAFNFSIFGAACPFVYFSVGYGVSARNYIIPMAGIKKLTYEGGALKL